MKIAVIGAGQMGAGIAQVAATSGHDVLLNDRSPEYIERGLAGIEKNLDRSVEKGRLTAADRNAVLGRIAPAPAIDVFDVDLAIEAATERLEIKLELFRLLDAQCSANARLASNTSSISITEIAAVTARPERVIGMHFMNPVPVMQLVEIIRGIATSQETFEFTRDLATQMGKTPVEVRDFPGFVSNRVLMPMINEAIYTRIRRRRDARSHRHRYEARHESSDGAADAGRFHRARHVLGDYGSAARRVRR